MYRKRGGVSDKHMCRYPRPVLAGWYQMSSKVTGLVGSLWPPVAGLCDLLELGW